jgi:hypothetical protein
MSSIIDRLRRRKDVEEQALEPVSLSPNPMVKEGQLAGVIALPFLIFLIAVLAIAKTYYISQEEFALMMGAGFAGWLCLLVGVYFVSVNNAIKHILFDREFGFTERLHPRFEVYCRPEDVRQLIAPDHKMKNLEDLKERLQTFGLESIADKFKQDMAFPKYLYYFKHRHAYEGWDADKHEVTAFQTHVVFMDKPFDQQFVFGAGQENWWGPIIYNHTHAESDNVKVLGWGLDPFTNRPMPICNLIHSTLAYKPKQEQAEQETVEMQGKQVNVLDAFKMLTAHQHGLIDSQRGKIEALTSLIKSKFEKIGDILKFARDIADVDIELFSLILKSRKTGRLQQIAKALMYVALIGGIVLVVWLSFHYIFGVWMPFLE